LRAPTRGPRARSPFGSPHSAGRRARDALLVFREWAYVATYRLYLDHRIDDAVGSTARQRFDLDATGVVPRIVLRDERVSFRAAIGQDSTIRVQLRPAGVASYEIHVRQGGTDTVLAQGQVGGPTSIVCPFTSGNRNGWSFKITR
jgi:hypothetical protein